LNLQFCKSDIRVIHKINSRNQLQKKSWFRSHEYKHGSLKRTKIVDRRTAGEKKHKRVVLYTSIAHSNFHYPERKSYKKKIKRQRVEHGQENGSLLIWKPAEEGNLFSLNKGLPNGVAGLWASRGEGVRTSASTWEAKREKRFGKE